MAVITDSIRHSKTWPANGRVGVASNSIKKAETWPVGGQTDAISTPIKSARSWLVSRDHSRDNITLEFAGPSGEINGAPGQPAAAAKDPGRGPPGKYRKFGVASTILGKIHFGWREKSAVEWNYYICRSKEWMRRRHAVRPIPRKSPGECSAAAEGIAELEARGVGRRRTLDSLCGSSVHETSHPGVAKPAEVLELSGSGRDSA